jgi:perosamine synthetase
MKFIHVNEPLLDGKEKQYLMECIDTGWISSEGPFVELFEKNMAAVVGRKHAVAVANGTGAIDIAIEALGIGAGDEVILPSFTIISCINQIIRSGATPILVDSDPLTWNMNVQMVEEKISAKTKAIMVPHIYGLPADIQIILDVAKKHKVFVIEDAAEMHGQLYRNQPCGSFGDISIFSFYANKNITTGEGGMILTDNEYLANTCRSLRNLCFEADNRFVHKKLGWNLRMTNVQAALGVAQLERLSNFVMRKREMGRQYNALFAGLPNVRLPLTHDLNAENIYWVYGLVLDPEKGLVAKEVMDRLVKLGVGCRPFFCPMHQQPVLQKMGLFHNEEYPIADELYRYGFYIPSGMALNKDQIRTVAESVWKVLG